MTKTKIVAAAAAIVAVAAVIGSVQAHQWGGPRHHGMMHKASMHGDWRGHRGGHHGGKWMCGMAKHIDGRLAFLKTELKITPEQEKLWEDFATVAKDNATSMQERCEAKKAKWKDAKEKGEGNERPPLPERLDARAHRSRRSSKRFAPRRTQSSRSMTRSTTSRRRRPTS